MRLIIFALGMIACFLIPAISIASSSPVPEALQSLVQEFPPLEEAFRRNKWEKAEQRLKGIETHYVSAFPKLMKAANGPEQRNKVSQFSFLIKDLKKQLASRERGKAEKSFHLFGGLIIEFIDFFDYEQHPLLAVFARKCGKMMTAVEFDKITAEMIEMRSAIKRMTPSLKKRGVPQRRIDASFEQLSHVLEAAQHHDRSGVHTHLDRLRHTYLQM